MGEGESAAKTAGGFANVIDAWSQKDAAAAGAWLQSRSSHPAYDQMATALARRVAETDGEGALAWADSIAGEAARNAARREAARAMLRAQGDTARPVLAAAGFSEEQIAGMKRNSLLSSYGNDVLLSNALSYSVLDTDARIAERTDLARATAFLQQQRAVEALAQSRAAAERSDLFVTDTWQAAGSTDAEFDQVSGRVLRSGVRTGDAGYHGAHPGGAPANCADCHR
jgi:hypothetical protein